MLTRKENLFLAKKYLAENIFNSAYIEGCNVTFPQTKAILDGAIINNVSADDVQTVFNLRDAWKVMLESLDEPLTVAYLCKINENVSRNESLDPGKIRSGNVAIGGTDYTPEIPTEEKVEVLLKTINDIKDPTERAIEYFAVATKAQLFWDGNKRTSTIVANKILIQHGQGIFFIGKDKAEEFNQTLQHYYNTDDKQSLRKCLKGCIATIEKEQAIEKMIKRKKKDFGEEI